MTSDSMQNNNQEEDQQQKTHGAGKEYHSSCFQIRIVFYFREKIVRRVFVPVKMCVDFCNNQKKFNFLLTHSEGFLSHLVYHFLGHICHSRHFHRRNDRNRRIPNKMECIGDSRKGTQDR